MTSPGSAWARACWNNCRCRNNGHLPPLYTYSCYSHPHSPLLFIFIPSTCFFFLSAEQDMRSLRLFLALPLAAAAPSADVLATPSSILSNLCQIPYLTDFYPVQEFCKRATRPIQVKNPKGKATSHGVVRYSGKYATATRWGPPVISSAWIAAYARFHLCIMTITDLNNL